MVPGLHKPDDDADIPRGGLASVNLIETFQGKSLHRRVGDCATGQTDQHSDLA